MPASVLASVHSKSSFLLAVLLLCLCLWTTQTAASVISFTQPTIGTVWEPGTMVNISWSTSQPSSGGITFNLLYGNPNSPRDLGVLVNAPSEQAGRVRITVPSTLATGNQYMLKSGNATSFLFSVVNRALPVGSPIRTVSVVQPVPEQEAASSAAQLGPWWLVWCLAVGVSHIY